jgi:ABC-type amino acid transport substrate-binding protein
LCAEARLTCTVVLHQWDGMENGTRRYGLVKAMRAARFGVIAIAAMMASYSPAPPPAPVRIATEGGRPPFNYVEDGKPAGFEVDLAPAAPRRRTEPAGTAW